MRKEVGIDTLVGDYAERGENHGKKCYEKLQKIPGHEEMKVFLYYWDNRDGADFAGWWFGNEVGGSQVWARCISHAPQPPRAGWKIPWDSPRVEVGLLTIEPYGAVAQGHAARGSRGAAAAVTRPLGNNVGANMAAMQIVTLATKEVDETASRCGKTLQAARQVYANASSETSIESLEQALKMLSDEVAALLKMGNTVTQHITEARKCGPAATPAVTELMKLSPRVRTLQASMTTEMNKVKLLVTKAREEAPRRAAEAAAQKEAEERDMNQLNETIPLVYEVASTAHEAVEAVEGKAEPLLESPPEDDGDECFKKVLDEVEQSASDAQTKINEARAHINSKLQAARKYAPDARKAALAEFSRLQGKITEAQKLLNPYKNFKEEFHNRIKIAKLVKQEEERLTGAEVEVAKVEGLGEGELSEDMATELDETITSAQATLKAVQKACEGHVAGAPSSVKGTLQQLIDRAKESHGKIDKVEQATKDQREKAMGSIYIKAGERKVEEIEAGLERMSATEMPFLKGGEMLVQECLDTIKSSEEAITELQTMITDIRTFFAGKNIQIRKFQKEVADNAKEAFQKLADKVNVAVQTISEFKKETDGRKRDVQLREANERMTAAEAKLKAMEEAVAALEEAAKPLLGLEEAELKSFATPLAVKTLTEKLGTDAIAKVRDLRAAAKEVQKEVQRVNTQAMVEVKRGLMKIVARCEASDRACSAAMEGVAAACKAIVDARAAQAQAALRGSILSRSVTLEALFSELSQSSERIPEEAMCKHLESLEGPGFPREQAQLLCRHIEVGGLCRRRFLAFLQQYFIVAKEIAVTSQLDISGGKTIRKAEPDEVIEVLEGPAREPKLGLLRVRGKLLRDGTEGWVSLKGNQGTAFLEEVEKPYFAFLEETPMDTNIRVDDGEAPFKVLQAEDVLELIEGPRREAYPPGLRIRGKAISDGAAGWIHVMDKRGVTYAEADDKCLTCIVSVAITDSEDIADCKVLRKLAVGEVVSQIEAPREDGESGLTRCKVTALKDLKEGWITTKGNAGTVYAKASGTMYKVAKAHALQKGFSSGKSEAVRQIEAGEAFQVLEGPREEKFAAEVRVKGRALADGSVGWITLKGSNVRPWSPFYAVVEATALHDKRSREEASTIRDLEVGESCEILEGPVREADELRMKARAEKDDTIGWVTIKDRAGKDFLRS